MPLTQPAVVVVAEIVVRLIRLGPGNLLKSARSCVVRRLGKDGLTWHADS